MKKLGILFLSLSCFTGCNGTGTSSGSNSNSSANDFHDNDPAYTLVVGYPYVQGNQTGQQYYNDLLNNLSPLQDNVPVSRILLSVQNPQINSMFTIGSSVSTSGFAVQFLYNLAQANTDKRIEVYAYPDVEISSGWSTWTPPTSSLSIASCAAINGTTDPAKQDVLKSICWAGAVNQLISSESTVLVGINGVAYDGQSFILSDTDPNRAWLYSQTSVNSLKLGWLSQGLKSSVDLNLIEAYGLYKDNHDLVRVDGIAPETVEQFFSSGFITPVCLNWFCSYTGIFPGTQWAAANLSGTPESGAVGANIYQCAISQESMLAANSCNSNYTSVINIESGPASQILQSLNYIYNYVADQELTQPMFFASTSAFPTPMPADAAIVYLFSTQYIGPMKSYTGSDLQCIESSGNCNCIASLYNLTASCGEENDFGAWILNLTEFKQFTNQFLVSQELDNKCPFPGGCATGIYMYDFIPQTWYSQ